MIALSICVEVEAQTEKGCVVEQVPAENGATIIVPMTVINNSTSCTMHRTLGGNPATSLTVHRRPVNGTLSTTRSSISYTPNPGFVGKDAFDVQWFGAGFGPNGRSHDVRTRVDVTVKAPDDALPDGSVKPAK